MAEGFHFDCMEASHIVIDAYTFLFCLLTQHTPIIVERPMLSIPYQV